MHTYFKQVFSSSMQHSMWKQNCSEFATIWVRRPYPIMSVPVQGNEPIGADTISPGPSHHIFKMVAFGEIKIDGLSGSAEGGIKIKRYIDVETAFVRIEAFDRVGQVEGDRAGRLSGIVVEGVGDGRGDREVVGEGERDGRGSPRRQGDRQCRT